MRPLKVVGYTALAVIGVPVLALGGLLLFVDPNAYKPQLASLVKQKTDLDLRLDDQLAWTVWPNIGVHLGKLSLTEPQHKEQLLAVNHAEVSVKLLPLLHKQIAVNALTLDGASVRYVVFADGSTSWDHLLTRLKSGDTSKPASQGDAVQLNVDTLAISHSQLALIDMKVNTSRTLSDIAVYASEIAPDQSFPLQVHVVFQQTDAAGKTLTASNDLKTRLTLAKAFDHVWLKNLDFATAVSGTLLPAPATVSLQGDVDADLKQQLHKVDHLALRATYADPALAQPASVAVSGAVVADMGKQLLTVNGLQVAASYPDKSLPQPATATVAGNVAFDIGKQLVNVAGLAVSASYPAANLSQPATARLTAEVQADLANKHAAVSGLSVDASYPDKALRRPATLKLTSAVAADWGGKQYALNNLAVNASYPAAQFAQPLAVALNAGAITADLKKGVVQVQPLDVQTLGVAIHGLLAATLPALAEGAKPGTPPTEGMSLSGNLASNTFNPRNVAAALGVALPKMQDAGLLQRASLSLNLAGDANSVMVRNLKLGMDSSTLSGDAGVTDLKAKRLFARLNLDHINLDGYLPPPAPAAAPAAQAAPAGDLLPVKLIREQNLDIGFNAGAINAMGYAVNGLQVAATAGNGLVNVSQLGGRIYNGSFSFPATIDVRGAQPSLSVKPNVQHIEVGPVARQVLKKDLFTGAITLTGALGMQGNNVDAWKRSLGGNVSFQFANGVMHGVNMMQLVMDSVGKYQNVLKLAGRSGNEVVSSQSDTPIGHLDSQATIANGLVNQTMIKADLNKAQLSGSGTFNLVSLDADYRLTMNLDRSVLGPSYAGINFPVRCKGNVATPAKLCGVDGAGLRDLLLKAATTQSLDRLGVPASAAASALTAKKQEVKAQVQQQIDAEKQKLGNQLQQQLGKGLQGLFGH